MNFDAYVDLLKSTSIRLGKEAVLKYLLTKYSFMALPIVSTITSFAVGKILEVALTKTEMGAFFLYIDLRTSEQGREYLEAAIKNRDVQLNGTEEEKACAEKILMDKFRSLAKFTS